MVRLLLFLFLLPVSGRGADTPAACCAAGAAQAKTRAILGAAGAPAGMVWVPGGEFAMGALDGDTLARADEKPRHRVWVDGFWMDETEVTNAEFAKFVEATGYRAVAERPVDWEKLKKDAPPGTPKPPDEVLAPGSLVFAPQQSAGDVQRNDWWAWVHGADWRHPQGPGSSIEGMENHPAVHIAHEDAEAYAKWAGKRLPTEAEWERAARYGGDDRIHPWGDEPPTGGKPKANTWDGEFPKNNTARDGHPGTSPVKSFPPPRRRGFMTLQAMCGSGRVTGIARIPTRRRAKRSRLTRAGRRAAMIRRNLTPRKKCSEGDRFFATLPTARATGLPPG
jgi:sulfatase modifying factor 1